MSHPNSSHDSSNQYPSDGYTGGRAKALKKKMNKGDEAMKRYKDHQPSDFAINRSQKKHNYKMLKKGK